MSCMKICKYEVNRSNFLLFLQGIGFSLCEKAVTFSDFYVPKNSKEPEA